MSTSSFREALEQVWAWLEAGSLEPAAEVLDALPPRQAAVKNARAVLWLRQGKAEQARETLRELVFPRGGLVMDDEADPAWKANFLLAW